MEVAYVVVSGFLLFLVRAALSRFFRKVGLGEGLIWLLVIFLAAAMAVSLLDPEKKEFMQQCSQRGDGYWDCQREYGRHLRRAQSEAPKSGAPDEEGKKNKAP
jgi:hypothetical protein